MLEFLLKISAGIHVATVALKLLPFIVLGHICLLYQKVLSSVKLCVMYLSKTNKIRFLKHGIAIFPVRMLRQSLYFQLMRYFTLQG